MSAIRLLDRKVYMASAYLQVSATDLACGSGLHDPILKEPQCRSIGIQIESTLNRGNSLV